MVKAITYSTICSIVLELIRKNNKMNKKYQRFLFLKNLPNSKQFQKSTLALWEILPLMEAIIVLQSITSIILQIQI